MCSVRAGRAILKALIAGETDPEKLADLARGTARKKRSELIEALHGRIRAHHRGLLKVHLELVGALGAHRFSVEAVPAADTADSLCASRPLLGIAAADRAEANAQTISVPFSMTGPACHPASAYGNDGPGFPSSAGRLPLD
jgi:hypothetical protein